MNKKSYRKNRLKRYARNMRRKPTRHEAILHNALIGRFDSNVSIYAQRIITPFIVDICIMPYRVVVEVDGASHLSEEAKKYDQRRTEMLNLRKYRVIRFRNSDIDNGLENVVNKIVEFCAEKQSDQSVTPIKCPPDPRLRRVDFVSPSVGQKKIPCGSKNKTICFIPKRVI